MNDLLIRNTLIVDGSGTEPFVGDVAVSDGRIVEIGAVAADAHESVDGSDLALAPGIIDSHTHYDAQITWDPWTSPSVSLGVTTAIMGNCGFTIAPCREENRELTLANLTQVEGMSFDALMQGTQWGFESFGEYLDHIERNGVGPNVACYCGHSAIRVHVMGEDAGDRAATEGEVRAMQSLLAEGLAEGAIGFATSTFEGHNGRGGRPMPSRLADESEIRALLRTLGEHGTGNFMLTKGSHTTLEFLESLAADSKRPVMVAALLHDNLNPDRIFQELDQISQATARGNKMHGQVSCSPMTLEFKLDSAYPFEILNTWQSAIPLYDDPNALAAMYAREDFRNGVRADLQRDVAIREYTPQFDRIDIVSVNRGKDAQFEGISVAEAAAAQGVDPLDWFLDFGIASDFGATFSAQILNADEAALSKVLRHRGANVSLSDAGAHQTLFCDAGFGLHLLGHWVRELGTLKLEEAVRLLSAAQADAYGILGRGRIAAGHHADLLLFDPRTVGRGARYRVSDLPAGASRLNTDAIGIHGVWINGSRVANERGRFDTEPPGHVLRQFA
jgi:N-acyl-D-amino-acid deacylase